VAVPEPTFEEIQTLVGVKAELEALREKHATLDRTYTALVHDAGQIVVNMQTYRSVLHHLQAAMEVTLDDKRARQLLAAVCTWSRADRTDPGKNGNPRPTEEQLQDILRRGMVWTAFEAPSKETP